MTNLLPHLGPRLTNHHACRFRVLTAAAALVATPLLTAGLCDVSTAPPPPTGVVREVVPAAPADDRGRPRDLVQVEVDDDGPQGPAEPRAVPVYLPAGECRVGDAFPACAED